MRHFLKFLSPEKRAEAERKYHDTSVASEAKKPLPSRSAAPRPPAKPVARPNVATPNRPSKTARPAPEFGGLIERRKQSRDQSARSTEQATQPPPVANRTPITPKSWDTRFDIDANEIKARIAAGALESTGVFLASLDNSAITLADSGLFKLDETESDDKEKSDEPGSFDPYNRG